MLSIFYGVRIQKFANKCDTNITFHVKKQPFSFIFGNNVIFTIDDVLCKHSQNLIGKLATLHAPPARRFSQ